MIARLILKELREHGWIMLCLIAGVLLNVLLLIELGFKSEFQVSGLSIIRTSLIYLFPLMAIILADRLVTREYLQRTRLFIEALPSGVNTQLIVKFFIGLGFLLTLAALVTTAISYLNLTLDSITPYFFGLLLARATVFTLLLWSIAFCFSLFGRVRWFLHLILAGVVVMVVSLPSIDANSIPAFSLISSTYFAFERDTIPTYDLVGTVLMAAVFLGIAALLIQRDKGSLSEKLASPMSRFDIAAIAILLMGTLSSFTVIMERDPPATEATPGKHSISFDNPSLIVSYGAQTNTAAVDIAAQLHEYLSELQRLLGYPAFTQVVVVHDADTPVEELQISSTGFISLTANLIDLSPYDQAALLTAAGHGILNQTSQGRGSFEPYHWFLDGIVRYQAEQHISSIGNNNHSQLLNMAAFTHVDQQLNTQTDFDLSSQWQQITDTYGYHMGIAVAYSAVDFLIQQVGVSTFEQLVAAIIGQHQPSNVLTSLRYLSTPFKSQFQSITGLAFDDFQQQWKEALPDSAAIDLPLINDLASVQTSVGFSERDGGFLYASGEVTVPEDHIENHIESCRMRFQQITAFDLEVAAFDSTESETDCLPGNRTLALNAFFDSVNRYYIQLDVRLKDFDRPWVIHSERLSPTTAGVGE